MINSPLYRLEVAPVIILPLGKSPLFSYTSDTAVPLGSLVAISFGKQHIEGVVYSCQALPGARPTWMKPITRVIAESFLTTEQRILAQTISEEYFTPLGKTLKHFLPKITKERAKPADDVVLEKKLQPLKASKEERLLLTQFTNNEPDVPCFLDAASLPRPKHFFALLAKKMQTDKKQLLIIVPETTLLPGLEHEMRTFFLPKNIAVLHSKLAHGAYFSVWERIRSGQATVIIATRQGLFAPFKNLGAVVVTDEQDESYKQWDMSPRYHGKRVASMLASEHHAALILSSFTPSSETLLAIQKEQLVVLGALIEHGPVGKKLSVINLRIERYRKNSSPLSLELVERIREALMRKEQSLLYINRQGMNAFSICENCKNIFRCPSCGSPLSSTKEGFFRCLSCSYKTGLFPNCPGCGHLNFKHIGFGTERIEKELARLFPYARIARVDSSTLHKSITPETLYRKGMAGEIDILVGTQMILKDPPLPKLSLIAMIDADSLLFFPDFQADEKLFQNLSRATLQVGTGIVLVQTFHPESAFLQRISAMDGVSFSKHLLMEREALFYPPYARIIQIAFTGKTGAAVTKKIVAATITLETVLPKGGKVHYSEMPYFLKRQGLFESNVIIRLPAHDSLTKQFTSTLIQMSKDGIVDIDPLALR